MGANLFKLHGQRANGNLYILWVDFCLFAARFTGMSRMPQSSSSRTPSKTKVLIPPASRSRAASPSKPSSSTVSPTRARTKSTPQTPSKSLRRAQPQDQPPVPKTPVNIREAIALKRAEVKKTERASSSSRNGGTSDDLTALDDAAIKHDVFPSHTAQNTLRRAWTAYAGAFGAGDQADSSWAVLVRDYLRNIAVDRVEAHRGGAVDGIQLRVVTRPIPAQAVPGGPRPAEPPAEIRDLPWWKVPS